MSYESKIRFLEEQYRTTDNKLFQLEKSGSTDQDQIKKLREEKDKYLSDLRYLRKLQWDEEHERVNFDDDR